MKKNKNGLIFIICFFLLGCGLTSSTKTVSLQKEMPLLNVEKIRPGRLTSGGNLLIVPFSPGEDVVADDKTERLSFKIVKGIADEIMREDKMFNILGPEDADQVHLMIHGRIEQARVRKAGPLWFSRKVHTSLSVSGKIIDTQDDSVIYTFSHQRSSGNEDETLEDLALWMGQDIANFLIDAASKDN